MNALLALALDEQIALGKLHTTSRPTVVCKDGSFVGFFFDRYGKQHVVTAGTEQHAYNKAYKAALKTAGDLTLRRNLFSSKDLDKLRAELKRP